MHPSGGRRQDYFSVPLRRRRLVWWLRCRSSGWGLVAAKHGSWMSLKDFMTAVKKLGDERPYYNLLACTMKGPQANCQRFAAEVYRGLTGDWPDTKGCPDCPSACHN